MIFTRAEPRATVNRHERRRLIRACCFFRSCPRRPFQAVATNLRRPGDTLVLLHAVPRRSDRGTAPEWTVALTTGISAPMRADAEDEELGTARLREAEAYVRRSHLPTLAASGVPPDDVRVEVVPWDTSCSWVGELVCEVARDVDAVVVVMAGHGKGALRDFFVGSVTNYCVRNSPVPVVVYNFSPEMSDRRIRASEEQAAKEEGAEDFDLPRFL